MSEFQREYEVYIDNELYRLELTKANNGEDNSIILKVINNKKVFQNIFSLDELMSLCKAFRFCDNTDEALDIITTSSILRATLTSKIKINDEAVYVEKMNKYVSVTTDSNNESICVLSKDELTNIVKAFNRLSSDANTSLSTSAEAILNLTEEDKNVLFDSSILRVFVCKALQLPQSEPNVIKTDASGENSIKLLTKAELLSLQTTL